MEDTTRQPQEQPEQQTQNQQWPQQPIQEQSASCYCRVCGRGLTAREASTIQGVAYCAEHAPASATGQAPPLPGGYPLGQYPEQPSPYTTGVAPVVGASPGLAFLLGLIPGVGAVYNAQYVKAIIHVVIFGLLISIVDSGNAGGLEPMFGMLIAIWYFYMPFEAYHTARKRGLGIPLDDFSSILPLKARASGFPVGPVTLIALGVIFLLAQFDLLSIHAILRYWPVALILLGIWMLYERMAQKPTGL